METLLKKHEAFERSAATQDERFSALERLTTVSSSSFVICRISCCHLYFKVIEIVPIIHYFYLPMEINTKRIDILVYYCYLLVAAIDYLSNKVQLSVDLIAMCCVTCSDGDASSKEATARGIRTPASWHSHPETSQLHQPVLGRFPTTPRARVCFNQIIISMLVNGLYWHSIRD